MRKPLTVVVAVLALLAAPLAQAGVGQGDLEAGINISLSNTKSTFSGTSTTSKSGTVGLGFGYFALDFLEIKAALTDTVSTSTTTGVFSPGADFVFLGHRKFAPFVGFAYGLAFGDNPAGSAAVKSDFYDVHAGTKIFVAERVSVEAKLTRFEPVDSKAKTANTELNIGVNIYF